MARLYCFLNSFISQNSTCLIWVIHICHHLSSFEMQIKDGAGTEKSYIKAQNITMHIFFTKIWQKCTFCMKIEYFLYLKMRIPKKYLFRYICFVFTKNKQNEVIAYLPSVILCQCLQSPNLEWKAVKCYIWITILKLSFHVLFIIINFFMTCLSIVLIIYKTTQFTYIEVKQK